MKTNSVAGGRAHGRRGRWLVVLLAFSAATALSAEGDSFGDRLLTAFVQDLGTAAYESPAPNSSLPSRRIPPAWPNKIMAVRPELRFDHSYDTPAFNNGTRQNQFVFSTDFILHF